MPEILSIERFTVRGDARCEAHVDFGTRGHKFIGFEVGGHETEQQLRDRALKEARDCEAIWNSKDAA